MIIWKLRLKFVVGATKHRLTKTYPLQYGKPAGKILQHLGMEKRVWETELKSVTSE